MSDKLEIQGKTVDGAVSEALLQMGARKDEVKITVLEEPKSGFLGILGNRQARVLVERKTGSRSRGRRNYQDRDDDHSAHDFGGGSAKTKQRDRGGQGGQGGQGGRGQGSQGRRSGGRSENTAGQESGGSRPSSRDQGESRGRSRQNKQVRREESPQQNQQGRRSRQDAAEQPRKNKEAASVEKSDRQSDHPKRASNQSRRGQGGKSRPRGDSENRPREDRGRERSGNPPSNSGNSNRRGGRPEATLQKNQNPAPTAELVPDTILVSGLKATNYATPVREVPESQLSETANSFTEGILNRAGFPCRCEVIEGDYRQVRVITGDESAGMLIGRHGSTVDAVEHLIDRMMGVAAGDRVRLNLDINNYRRRREDVLGSRVAEAVARVLETERDYHIEPMCARERRLIHLEAEKYDSIRTYTLMRSGDKHVVIALDKDGASAPLEQVPGEPTENDDKSSGETQPE
ncbi:MAG: Jag N-terminal domain-containing protein [Gemmatimonadales bacterium]|nr:Jag N-terminal domain-containing protein [Gemmatimonadales bacterium]